MRLRLLVIMIWMLASGCSEFQKIKKSTDPDFKFRKAVEYFNSEDYARSLDLLEDIRHLYRGKAKAQTIDYYFAFCLYEQKQYLTAGHYFNNFVRTYPNSSYSEECTYMKAYCYYKASPKPRLDQDMTEDAIETFNLYVKRYPQSQRVEESQKLIKELEERLVEKSYLSAQSYFHRGESCYECYKSAIISLQNSLEDYPDSKHRESIRYMILKSRYELATYSIPEKKNERYNAAKEEYYVFTDEFPESANRGAADRMLKNINKYLGIEE